MPACRSPPSAATGRAFAVWAAGAPVRPSARLVRNFALRWGGITRRGSRRAGCHPGARVALRRSARDEKRAKLKRKFWPSEKGNFRLKQPLLEAPRRLQQMRAVVAILVACTPHAAAAAALVARGQAVLESGASAAAASDDVHQPFTNVLSNVHATLFNVTRDVETVEQSGPGSGPASQLRKHTESALHEIEQVRGLDPTPPNRPRSFPARTLDASKCSLWTVTLRRGLRAYGMCGAALRLPRGCHRL